MTAFDAVIFDWSGTLVHDPPLRERVVAAGARLGRPDSPEVDRICAALMVGDRSTHDGAAAECGMATLVLPRLPAYGRRGLSLVESLVRG